jgi:hypothetical protein
LSHFRTGDGTAAFPWWLWFATERQVHPHWGMMQTQRPEAHTFFQSVQYATCFLGKWTCPRLLTWCLSVLPPFWAAKRRIRGPESSSEAIRTQKLGGRRQAEPKACTVRLSP